MNQDRVFRLDEALSRIDHDRETFRMMVELFLDHGPKDLAAIKSALENRDSVSVAQFAHRLKGSILQFCAAAAIEAAKELERLGKAGDLTEAGRVCVILDAELMRLVDALRLTLDQELAA